MNVSTRAALLFAFLSACAPHERFLLRPTPSSLAAPGPVVGVATVDITPPVGSALGGHGPNGLLAQGRRGHLECGVVFFADARGEAFAWASCDLPFVSTLLQREVSMQVRQRAGSSRSAALGSDRLVIAASHTHAGPAHFLDAVGYTEPSPGADGFSPPHPGFDPTLSRFLSERLASAVLRACQDAETSAAAEVRWLHGTVAQSISLNQSVEAHCLNREERCASPPVPREEVDRALDVLQVLRAGRTAAVLFFFGVHPTAVPNGADVFHADLVESARTRVRAKWSGAPLEPDAVVAFVNGAEGDVASAPLPGSDAKPGFRLAREVGRALGDAVLALAQSRGGAEPLVVSRASADVALAGGQPVIPGITRPLPCGTPRWRAPPRDDDTLCPLGATGAGAAGGSEDGPTVFRQFPFSMHEGLTAAGRGCQRPKRPLVLGLIEESAPCEYPEVAPLTLVRLGSRAIVTVPFEPTVTVARRLRRAAQEVLGAAPVLASLSNGYLQYVATGEEYSLQHYEAASTLYGPEEARFFEQRVRALASSLGTSRPVEAREWWTEVVPLPSALRLTEDERTSQASLARALVGGRPGHAVPLEEPPCAPVRAPVPRELLLSPGLVTVRVVDPSGVVLVNSLGVELTDAVQDLELRLTSTGAEARWYPERCDEAACLEVNGVRRCAAELR